MLQISDLAVYGLCSNNYGAIYSGVPTHYIFANNYYLLQKMPPSNVYFGCKSEIS